MGEPNTTQIQDLCTASKISKSQQYPVSKVRVIVRVRPFLPQEVPARNGNQTSCVSLLTPHLVDSGSGQEVTLLLKDQDTSRNECYKLDGFFDQEDNNLSQIFEKEVSPLIPGLFHGCNATVFAYGATGSGKTYTMQGTDEFPGLMPLAMSSILSMCQKRGYTAEISYYEVYMDRCYDLLELKAKEIAVQDDQDGHTHLRGLCQAPVNSMSEFHEVFSTATQRRKVAHTGLNDVSSRSHGALVISVSAPSEYGSGNIVTGKLNLIDLAGNEDNRRTFNEGIRLQESAKINQSLFALSNVIYALNNNRPRVPYRESKLTRILQDSLGGTSRAVMVACLNPGEYQESVHTVSLAARSRHISNFVSSAQKHDTPRTRIDMEAKLRDWLEMKGKTKSAQRVGPFYSASVNKTPGSVASVKKQNGCQQLANPSPLTSKERVAYWHPINLFSTEILPDADMENLESNESTNNNFKVSAATIDPELKCYITDGLLDEEGRTTDIKHAVPHGSSRTSDVMTATERSGRKVLSLIISNAGNSVANDSNHPVPCDPKTPKTPFALNSETDKLQDLKTPLDKFNACSTNLKSSLVQQYIDFLNTASREELLELKGIGQKMAEYILDLRETSPLKSLGDLEKLGLSSKQVHNMFGRAAKGILL